MAPLDLHAVARRRAGNEPAGLLLDPAKGGDVVVGAEQDPGLARAGLRGEVGLPLGEAVSALGDPPRHRRGAPIADRVLEHRQGEAVDLEEDDPGGGGARLGPLSTGDALNDAQRVLVVVVRARQHLEDDGGGERRPDRLFDRS